MSPSLRTAIVCSFLCLPALSACSLTTGFDDFKFSEDKGGNKDAGGAGSGAGNGSDGGMRDSGTDAAMAGSGGMGGNGGMGGKGDDKDAGMDSAVPEDGGMDSSMPDTGVDAGPECTKASDCGDILALDCVNNECVARRVASGVWLSGGGGLVTTPTAKIRVSIGAPLPMGKASSATFKITVGAGAGRP